MMAKHFRCCFGHDINKSTIGDIVENSKQWLSIVKDESSLSLAWHAKKKKIFEFPLIAFVLFFCCLLIN